MARIAGVDLPRNKRGIISLTYVFGVGATRSAEILDAAGVDHVPSLTSSRMSTRWKVIFVRKYKRISSVLWTLAASVVSVTVRACHCADSVRRPMPAHVRVSVRQ